MEPNSEDNLLEIMDLARTLRQEQLFIQQEQAAFAQFTESLSENSAAITKLAYICAQQRQNLNDLITSRPEASPSVCCRRAKNYENAKYIDAKKVLDYEHAIAYEELFNHLYRSPYLLALSLATGDRIAAITPQHLSCVIHSISAGLYGNTINTKDVEMILKLLRELIEIQVVVSENPRSLLRANASAFARLYHRLNESMFSAKIFLTAALFEPIMGVLSDIDSVLDVDPSKVVENFSSKERLKRFGAEDSNDYQENINKFHNDTITKLHVMAKSFIDSLTFNWSLFPSTLRWLVQTMSHQLKQSHFSDKIINEIITDMVFTHFICPAIVSPDIMGIIDAPIPEQVRFNLIQIGQIIQMLALAKHDDVDAKFAQVHAKFESNMVSNLIDLLLMSQSGEDVVAILSQQSDFDRSHLLSTQSELAYFVEFYRILMANDDFEPPPEDRQKLQKILSHLPESTELSQRLQSNGGEVASALPVNGETSGLKERSKQGFMGLSKVTKNKIAKSMSFSTNNNTGIDGAATSVHVNGLTNGGGHAGLSQAHIHDNHNGYNGSAGASTNASVSSNSSSPIRAINMNDVLENEPILVFSIYNGDEHKLQPLTEEEVLKMNCIGQDISNGEALLVDTGSVNLENTIDKSSSVANGFDGMDNMSDVLRPLHSKTTRFSLSHDDASIGNSDNLEAVSEAPSNHSVTSSLELEEENDQNDNLSDMVSANVSGRGSPNISGRDTPSSQVTDGESVHNALPTPQMQKLISKARSDIEDKFCKFEIKKFEGDETVSIISDTWSTDVLASDSETVDAGERERDRNFSTPLIPSAVVLPGDNNFDVLTGAGVMRPAFLDVSDQRSESNWSTDVLASDSEKFAEVDTDDNLSITAKSDITDSGARSEQERDQLAAAISAAHTRRIPNSPYYTARNGRTFRSATATNYNVPAGGNSVSGALNAVGKVVRAAMVNAGSEDGGAVAADGSHGSGSSDHSQDDSAFYDAANLYDEAAATVKAEQDAAAHYGLSSLARSSVRTTNQYSGENNFQQDYKSSSGNADGKEAFLGAPRMRRQTSAESSISNQSVTFEDAAGTVGVIASKPPKSHHKGGMKKKKQHNNSTSSSHKDLIDFSDFGEEERPPISVRTVIHDTSSVPTQSALIDLFVDENVVHRHTSNEARNASFDGRRNGIMAMKGNGHSESAGNHASVPVLRRHQSLNYENHELMISNVVNSTKRVTMIADLSQTDDAKSQQQQIMLLCAKTEKLQLNDTDNGTSESVTLSTSRATLSNHTSGIGTASAATSSLSIAVGSTSSCQKPTKSTGAIPKSISFDASADKNTNSHNDGAASTSNSASAGPRHLPTHRNARVLYPNMGAHISTSANSNSGIFNKLKQGIFKHRRGNKSHSRHSTHLHNGVESVEAGGASGEYSTPHTTSSRSVSFSANTSELSLEMIGVGGGSAGARNTPAAGADNVGAIGGVATSYGDINEDILAKYRRKVSSSSEATNSDSMGNCLAGAAASAAANELKLSEAEAKSPNTLLHDKTLAFNVIKKKIRTVLSKTDLHTGDFRHTTYTNASPLLTYLQIQLAQALNLQNFQQISYVSEAIRCISTLERSQHTQLLEELQQDIQKRQNYLQYLMRYRQNQLLMMENIEQFETRLRSESATCNRYLMAVCVRLFFEKRQAKLAEFQAEFARLTVSDDKIELIEEFVDGLMEELLSPGGILHGMPEWQAQEARQSIERILLTRLYQQVMFPNEDADLSRDTVLSDHIRKLQRVISPSHPALCIPQAYLSEAPWSFSQQQLSYISAYKTPREKLQCVIRCISSIMSLLHMSSGRVPAADDILPVLIYVVIMTNPPFLLSTVEYITCFIGEKLEGEEQFHWTLFCSVVKFIKTMDYLD